MIIPWIKKLHGRFLFAIKLFDLHKMAKQSDFVNNNQRAIFLLFTTIFYGYSAAVVLQMLWDWIIKLMSRESPFRGYLCTFITKWEICIHIINWREENFQPTQRRKSIPSQRLSELIHFCALVNSPPTLQDCEQTFYEIQIREQISSLCKPSDG